MLALAGHDARRWEPKRLRLRLFSIAARLAEHGRTRRLHLSAHAPWAGLLAQIIKTLRKACLRPAERPSTRPDNPAARTVEPAPTERPRANSHTLPAQSPATLGNNAETIKNAGGTKDPG
jgi:Transposase DDE domain group 1